VHPRKTSRPTKVSQEYQEEGITDVALEEGITATRGCRMIRDMKVTKEKKEK